MTSIVTEGTVEKAIVELEKFNLRPTVKNIRAQLGGGSNTKILGFLSEYLRATRPVLPPMSEEQENQFKQLLEAICEDRAYKLVGSYKERLEDMELQLGESTKLVEEMEEQKRALKDENEALKAEMATFKQEYERIQKELESMQSDFEESQKKNREEHDKLVELRLREGDYFEAKKEGDEAKGRAAKMEGRLEEMEKILDKLDIFTDSKNVGGIVTAPEGNEG
jgi:chromosome segregation ATPase